MYNPQPSPNIHKLISKVNVQSSAQHQRTQTNFQNTFQIPGPHPSYGNNFQNRCPISSPTNIHIMNFSTHFESPAQSSHSQNKSQTKSSIPRPVPTNKKTSSKINVNPLAYIHHTLIFFKTHIQSFRKPFGPQSRGALHPKRKIYWSFVISLPFFLELQA